MPRPISIETAWKIGLALPDVERGTTYGTPALKVRGQVMACVPTHRSAEPRSLVVRVDFAGRPDMLAADPDVYYLPDHYRNGPFILVRLSRIHVDALRDLLAAARTLVLAKPARRRVPQHAGVRGRPTR